MTENGLFCGTFRVFPVRELLIFGRKSNKETPKEFSPDPLTTLSPPPINSLEFPYCFWTRNSAFSHLLTLGAGLAVRFRGP